LNVLPGWKKVKENCLSNVYKLGLPLDSIIYQCSSYNEKKNVLNAVEIKNYFFRFENISTK